VEGFAGRAFVFFVGESEVVSYVSGAEAVRRGAEAVCRGAAATLPFNGGLVAKSACLRFLPDPGAVAGGAAL
jgi:hypothetical protein